MVKIVLDAGHGLNTPGKRTPSGEREWTFNNKVVLAAINKLNRYENVQILRVDDPTGETDVSLEVRTSKANAFQADVYIACHHNAYTGNWGSWTGVETYTYDSPQANSKSLEIAKVLHPLVVKAIGLQDRGLKKQDFHVLRETTMPAILIEGGFMDSYIDINVLRDNSKLKAHGEAIAEGVALYFGLKPNGEVKPSEPPIIKEEENMLEKAIVIGSFNDYPAAEVLAVRVKAPIYPRGAIQAEVAKELIVVGSGKEGLKANKITDLSGSNRFETFANVEKYLRG